MPSRRDVDWDLLDFRRADHLIARKQDIEAQEKERVGWEPDWKLRVVMLREQREEAFAEIRREVANRPEIREQRSRILKSAWEAGKFANRKQGYAKRTDELVARAQKLKTAGVTFLKIGELLNISAYTAARWCGWERKGFRTNCKAIVVDGVTYPSMRAAERATGICRPSLVKKARSQGWLPGKPAQAPGDGKGTSGSAGQRRSARRRSAM